MTGTAAYVLPLCCQTEGSGGVSSMFNERCARRQCGGSYTIDILDASAWLPSPLKIRDFLHRHMIGPLHIVWIGHGRR